VTTLGSIVRFGWFCFLAAILGTCLYFVKENGDFGYGFLAGILVAQAVRDFFHDLRRIEQQ
jgi:hypothetical protein